MLGIDQLNFIFLIWFKINFSGINIFACEREILQPKLLLTNFT